MLLMRKEFFEAIRAGAKTTTLRFWRSARVRPDSVHTMPGLGRVLVTSVRQVRPGELTDDDARRDGFAGAAELRTALRRLYPPGRRRGRRLFLVGFRLLDGRAGGRADGPLRLG